MGIALSALRFLLAEGKEMPWHGDLLTLGRQDISFSDSDLHRAAAEQGYALHPVQTPRSDEEPNADVSVFRALGFESVSVLDANAYENATVIHDLNDPSVPVHLLNSFDLVLDAGTLEHVFDIPCALRNLCKMTREGGRIIHISPVSNCVDHGFYSFSPTLFADFYEVNGFEVRRMLIARFISDPISENWEMQDYDPVAWGRIGALQTGAYFLLACVMRNETSTWDKVPQQSYYKNHAWRQRRTHRSG